MGGAGLNPGLWGRGRGQVVPVQAPELLKGKATDRHLGKARVGTLPCSASNSPGGLLISGKSPPGWVRI